MNANELTDEEIRNVFFSVVEIKTDDPELIFAREIIKKTQEKIMQSVMSKNCTCYKLGYSPLNDYALVKQK